MTAFRYQAVRADGAMVNGSVDATTVPEASGILAARGLYPVHVEADQERTGRRLPPRRESAVFESLASFVDAGVPLHQALHATKRMAEGDLKMAIGRAAQRVHEGASLSAALLAERGMFSATAIGLVRAGEAGTGLGPALGQAVAQLERDAEASARIRAALAYPILLAVVGTASVTVITLFIVPRFVTLLGNLGQTLPLATRLLVSFSEIARHYGTALAIGGVAAAIGLQRLLCAHRVAWHGWLLSLPLIGSVRHGFATARACRTLSALLASGTPALTALDVARGAAGDAAVARRLLDAKARVAEGTGLSSALSASRALTPNAQQLASIGDQSGRLASLLAKAADMEDRDAERRLKTLVAFVEPALILAFAGVVAFVAAALLQAVYAVRPG
jgi:general secretion pathway protein F